MLEVREVDVYRGPIQVLWRVSLEVNKGEVVSLIGPNGAGKTTLLSTVVGLLKPAWFTPLTTLRVSRVSTTSTPSRS